MEHCTGFPFTNTGSIFSLPPVLLSALESIGSHAVELAQSHCEADNSHPHSKHYCALVDTWNVLLCSTGLRSSSRCAR